MGSLSSKFPRVPNNLFAKNLAWTRRRPGSTFNRSPTNFRPRAKTPFSTSVRARAPCRRKRAGPHNTRRVTRLEQAPEPIRSGTLNVSQFHPDRTIASRTVATHFKQEETADQALSLPTTPKPLPRGHYSLPVHEIEEPLRRRPTILSLRSCCLTFGLEGALGIFVRYVHPWQPSIQY
jgi:hypothetical protein